MRPEYTLDEAATLLPPQTDWNVAVSVGRTIAQHMAVDGIDGHSRHYWLNDAQQTICGVSEQPDLTGEVEVVLHNGEGEWVLQAGGRELPFPRYSGRYIGFSVGDVATTATLMQVVLPTNIKTARLLQHGVATCFSHTGSQKGIMERYDTNDLALNPRRVQVAAQLMRTIFNQELPARPSSFKTDQEEMAFMDKYFPYQDVPLTGGGGQTVRTRVAR